MQLLPGSPTAGFVLVGLKSLKKKKKKKRSLSSLALLLYQAPVTCEYYVFLEQAPELNKKMVLSFYNNAHSLRNYSYSLKIVVMMCNQSKNCNQFYDYIYNL